MFSCGDDGNCVKTSQHEQRDAVLNLYWAGMLDFVCRPLSMYTLCRHSICEYMAANSDVAL